MIHDDYRYYFIIITIIIIIITFLSLELFHDISFCVHYCFDLENCLTINLFSLLLLQFISYLRLLIIQCGKLLTFIMIGLNFSFQD